MGLHPRVLLALVLVAAGLLGALLVVAGREERDAGGFGSPTGFEGAVRPPIEPTPLTGLRDQDGAPVDLAALRGRPVVVTFLYTTCEDTCPLTARQIGGALDRLGEDVPALAVSVDPANDTPERARAFLKRMRLEGRMRFLLGSPDALRRQWRAYGMQPQTDTREHSGHTVLLDGRGVQRVGWPADKLTPDGLAADLRTLRAAPAAARAALVP
jgi:protein SCO1/2